MSTTMESRTATATFDRSRAEGFGDRVLAALNEASVLLMMSIGHRLGLFERLSTMPPSTSREIAAAAGLNERYVREWLSALAVGRVLEITEEDGDVHFSLSAEHAAMLTSTGEADLSVFAQYIPLLASVEDDILRCFREGAASPTSASSAFTR